MLQDLSNINYFTDFLFLPSEAVKELQLGDEANLFWHEATIYFTLWFAFFWQSHIFYFELFLVAIDQANMFLVQYVEGSILLGSSQTNFSAKMPPSRMYSQNLFETWCELNIAGVV